MMIELIITKLVSLLNFWWKSTDIHWVDNMIVVHPLDKKFLSRFLVAKPLVYKVIQFCPLGADF